MPTPKSKPSRTKNPVHKIATTPNQSSAKAHVLLLVGQHGSAAGFGRLLVLLGFEVTARVPEHQEQVHHGQDR